MKDENKKETDTEMLARMMANGFEQLGNQIKSVYIDLQNQINEHREETRTGFSDLRLEIRDLTRQVEALERKLSGLRESIDNASTKSEYKELRDKVLAMEVHFA